ncbi:MAG TPA: dNTP triphosphohydrolase, partial [Chthoniobacterales bacterium]
METNDFAQGAPLPAKGWKRREQIEADEQCALAPYALKSGDSRGRKFPEPRHEYRTEFQRDRARIIHSRAFRRLEYKTQVFLNGTADHLRTRLTHTIEVASISRTIARALGLNEDLAEAIALAHDLGHAPFGHSGEEMLAECMREHGGFEHNRQSLRVVELLEHPYPDFAGLNLTVEVLDGLRKHRRRESRKREASATLEAQVADVADEITYYSHDLDDALDFAILESGQLDESAIWRRSHARVRKRHQQLLGAELHKNVIRDIIDLQVRDVVAASAAAIEATVMRNPEEASRQPVPLIRYSEE